MGSNRQLDNVVLSLKFMLDYMTPADTLSVITFGSDATVVLRHVATTPEQKDLIRFRLDQLRPEGMTNLSAALSCVPDLVLEGAVKQGLLLLTDGEVNQGLTDHAALRARVMSLLADHPSLSLTMVGYGEGHNTELCRTMAEATSGTYDVVQTLDHVATVFGNTLGGLTTCAFQQVRLALHPGCRQISAFPERDGAVFVGDLLAGNEVVVLLESEEPFSHPLVVRGTNVQTGLACEIPVVLHPSPTPEEVMAGLVASLRFRVVALLEKVRLSREGADVIRAECDEIRGLLEPLPPSSLVTLLLAEVERCRTCTASPVPLSRYQTTLLSQRRAYLGLGHGVLSEEGDPSFGPPTGPPVALDRTFSNPVQRSMSEGLRYTTSIASPTADPGTASASGSAYADPDAVSSPTPRSFAQLTRTNTQV